MWYNSICRDEQNTGALLFSKATVFSQFRIVGKAPSMCGHSSLAARLDNGSARGGRFAMGRPHTEKELIALFWMQVKVNKETSCWEWQGTKDGHGYGTFSLGGGKSEKASRFSWQYYNGEIPDGLFACHICDNPPCVNPNHLFLGTATDNMQDMIAKGRAGWQKKIRKPDRCKDQCKNGHLMIDDNIRIINTKRGPRRVCKLCQDARSLAYRRRHREETGKSSGRNSPGYYGDNQ
jgi:hypothetical protein